MLFQAWTEVHELHWWVNTLSYHCYLGIRDHSGYGLSQWETTLPCNVFSHWLSPYLEWSLWYLMLYRHICCAHLVNISRWRCHQNWAVLLLYPQHAQFSPPEASYRNVPHHFEGVFMVETWVIFSESAIPSTISVPVDVKPKYEGQIWILSTRNFRIFEIASCTGIRGIAC